MNGKTKDAILGFVKEMAPEEARFVIDLCNQNSFTYNREGTNRVADLVLERLDGVLAHHETLSRTETGDHHILRSAADRGPIYLLGHMDTVFPPDHDFQTCTEAGKWLRGPGTGDMKGGLAVIVYALLALRQAGLVGDLGLTLILSSDEEVGAVTSQEVYEREREKASACLVAECAGRVGEVVLSRNGKAGARLECSGHDRHVGSDEDVKASAILELAHKIVALEALDGMAPNVTVNVGTIEGGLGPCTVPAQARCLVDLRWQDEEHGDALLARVRRISDRCLQPGCTCVFTLLNQRPAMPPTDGARKMFGELKRIGRELGIDLRCEHRRGTSDANYFGAAGVPTLDGLGPICVDDHTPEERILVSSLAERTALLALFLAEHGPELSAV